MKLFLSSKFEKANFENLEKIKDIFEKNGHKIVIGMKEVDNYGTDPLSPKEMMVRTKSLLEDCDGLLIYLYKKGTGIGIEAGLANQMGKPIFVITLGETSESLMGISDKWLEIRDILEIEKINFKYFKK